MSDKSCRAPLCVKDPPPFSLDRLLSFTVRLLRALLPGTGATPYCAEVPSPSTRPISQPCHALRETSSELLRQNVLFA